MEMNFTKVVPVQAAEDKGGSSSGNDLKLTFRPAPKVFWEMIRNQDGNKSPSRMRRHVLESTHRFSKKTKSF